MIFARVDVTLPRHPRVLAIKRTQRARALGVYLAALCYTREHELDGFVPTEALDGLDAVSALVELVRVGLLVDSVRGDVYGYNVHNYANKNETRDAISIRRAESRARVAAFRERQRGNAVGNALHYDPCNASVSGSGSVSRSPDLQFGSPETRDKLPITEGCAENDAVLAKTSAVAAVRGAHPSAFGVPDDIAITEEIRTNCVAAGLRIPARADVVACLAHARQEGRTYPDWGWRLVRWMGLQKTFDARTPKGIKVAAEDDEAARKARHVARMKAFENEQLDREAKGNAT